MAKQLECGCRMTADMRDVISVCDAHKDWQMKMSAFAYETATERAPNLHRDILRKLMLQEYDFFGECQTIQGGSLDDGASSYVQFTDEEKATLRAIADEAHVEWLVARFAPDAEGLPTDEPGGSVSRPK